MKRIYLSILNVVFMAVLLSGCAAGYSKVAQESSKASVTKIDKTEILQDRMLIWKAFLTVEVWEVNDAAAKVIKIAEENGGYVERKFDNGQSSANIRLRIPAKAFKNTIGTLETLGTVISRRIEGEDVTEQYVDIEARLKNKIALRDRLKQLLDKAKDVKDILAIEAELNRVQSDIDSMEGRIKVLKAQIDFATVELTLERKMILGPLGYLFKGLLWGIEKLFVIRE